MGVGGVLRELRTCFLLGFEMGRILRDLPLPSLFFEVLIYSPLFFFFSFFNPSLMKLNPS